MNITINHVVDVVVVILGLLSVYYINKTAVGGKLGSAFRFIGLGLIILAVNHLFDTLWFAAYFKNQTVFGVKPGGPVVHRLINLVGFVSVFFGYFRATKAFK